MYLDYITTIIVCCVTHLYVQNTNEHYVNVITELSIYNVMVLIAP